MNMRIKLLIVFASLLTLIFAVNLGVASAAAPSRVPTVQEIPIESVRQAVTTARAGAVLSEPAFAPCRAPTVQDIPIESVRQDVTAAHAGAVLTEPAFASSRAPTVQDIPIESVRQDMIAARR